MSLATPAATPRRRPPRPVDRGRIASLLAEELDKFERRTPLSRARHQREGAGRAEASSPPRAAPPSPAPHPIYLERREHGSAWDLDGNRYTDFAAQPRPGAAAGLLDPGELALRFGLPRWSLTAAPGESVGEAVRIARAATGRDALLKAEGADHGPHEALMVSVLPPLEALGERDDPLGVPDRAGLPRAITDLTGAVPFNDAGALESVLERIGSQVAALVLEPALTRIGLVPAAPGYLDRAHELAAEHGVLLILDETRTFPVLGPAGGGGRAGVVPDLLALGGAVGMSEGLAAHAAQHRDLGLPAGGPALLEAEAHERMDRLGLALASGCERIAAEHRLAVEVSALGGMGSLVFSGRPIRDLRDHLAHADGELAALAWLHRANRGIFTTPGTESWTLSPAHDTDAVADYLEAFEALASDLTERGDGGT